MLRSSFNLGLFLNSCIELKLLNSDLFSHSDLIQFKIKPITHCLLTLKEKCDYKNPAMLPTKNRELLNFNDTTKIVEPTHFWTNSDIYFKGLSTFIIAYCGIRIWNYWVKRW